MRGIRPSKTAYDRIPPSVGKGCVLAMRALFPKLEPWVFLVFAATCTLLSARLYFDARQSALQFAESARLAAPPESIVHLVPKVPWSAPLDDVFIHFDFARSLARGRFFEWAPGGGYSSGATSWLYPAVLAIAYRCGLTGFALGRFADWFASVCVFCGLWALRGAYKSLSLWVPYLLSAALMSLGVFGWALWSGMELPLFFALWCLGQAVFHSLQGHHASYGPRRTAWLLSLLCLLLAATRPESLLCVVVWLLFLGLEQRKLRAKRGLALLGAIVAGPALVLIAIRMVCNRVLTGEFGDAGSIVKLEPLAPYANYADALKLWSSHLAFQFGRITAYHAADNAIWGSLLWPLVILSLCLKSTRRHARVLCLLALFWMALVANNEYVRYQNDRYTMPALAWLVMAASLSVWGLAHESFQMASQARPLARRLAPGALALSCTVIWTWHQIPRLRQQSWLFGRACRNVAEQQVRLGLLLDRASDARHRRILVGDAGAIEYFSDLPAVDAIGLGGTRDLPFARAARVGVGAILELIERLPPQERPDLLALYPSWWKELPLWFGRPVLELPIDGNVICGASSKVVYDAEWRGLNFDSPPCFLDPGWRLVDELDVADLVSESNHSYRLSERHSGYVLMKLLPHLRDPSRDLFDAGRILFQNQTASFQLDHLTPGRALRLVVRAAPAEPMRCVVRYDGRDLGQIRLQSKDSWQESGLDVSPALVKSHGKVEILSALGECNLFHIWALQPEL